MFNDATPHFASFTDKKKSSIENLIILTLVSSILIVRGWGAQSRLDWEDTFGIGLTLSRGVGAIWEPNFYGVLTARLLQLFVVQFPLTHLPEVIFAIVTIFWMINLAMIFVSIKIATKKKYFALLVVIGLALLPTPLIGVQGSSVMHQCLTPNSVLCLHIDIDLLNLQ
jgi:hypothetical protein